MQLKGFLKKSWSDKLAKAAREEDQRDGLGGGQPPGYTAGVRDGWSAVGELFGTLFWF